MSARCEVITREKALHGGARARSMEGGAHVPSREREERSMVALWKSPAFLDDADLHTTVVLLRNDA